MATRSPFHNAYYPDDATALTAGEVRYDKGVEAGFKFAETHTATEAAAEYQRAAEAHAATPSTFYAGKLSALESALEAAQPWDV